MILEWTPQAKECLAVQYNCQQCSLVAYGYNQPRCKIHHAVKWMVVNGNLPESVPIIPPLTPLLGKAVALLKKGYTIEQTAFSVNKRVRDLRTAFTRRMQLLHVDRRQLETMLGVRW